MIQTFKQKVKAAFRAVKQDISKTRSTLSGAVFSLSNEYARLQLRVKELEKRLDELEAQQPAAEQPYSYAKGY